MTDDDPAKSPSTVSKANQQQTQHQSSPSKIGDQRNSSSDPKASNGNRDYDQAILNYLPKRRDRLERWTARWAPLVTFFNLSIIVFTAFLVLITNRQADISDKQRRDGEAVQRAFVFLDNIYEVPVINTQTNKVGEYRFYPRWKNSGVTPTRHMIGHVNVRSFHTPLSKGYDYPDKGCEDPNSVGAASRG